MVMHHGELERAITFSMPTRRVLGRQLRLVSSKRWKIAVDVLRTVQYMSALGRLQCIVEPPVDNSLVGPKEKKLRLQTWCFSPASAGPASSLIPGTISLPNSLKSRFSLTTCANRLDGCNY